MLEAVFFERTAAGKHLECKGSAQRFYRIVVISLFPSHRSEAFLRFYRNEVI